MPRKPQRRWDEADLIRRVLRVLGAARRVLELVCSRKTSLELQDAAGLMDAKIVAETAMLLLCLDPIVSLDARLREQSQQLAELLIPHARGDDVLAAMCLDPGSALDHGVAHIILGRLGYPDRDVDELLQNSLNLGPQFGPERLPHRRLERAWLTRVWAHPGFPASSDSRPLAESALGRSMDALRASRLDIYAFTHAVMYASDLGCRQVKAPRSRAAIAADAEASLSFSLETGDYDLTAELLLTLTMLNLPWSATTNFAFKILADAEDRLGFLPGGACDLAQYHTLTGATQQSRFALTTSYHTIYVMGFLCATALLPGRTPWAAVHERPALRGSAATLQRLVNHDQLKACWREAFELLDAAQRDAVSPLLLTIVMRQATASGNVALLRQALEIALTYDLVRLPAVTQGLALLRRSQLLKPKSH